MPPRTQNHANQANFLPAQEPLDSHFSSHQDSFSGLNPHDQAFIVYSDEDILSRSSHSHLSDSRSVSFSHRSHSSRLSHQSNLFTQNINILDELANDESSILDVRESECSESCKELLHTLEPLFNSKSFVRRSPRFIHHHQPTYTEAISIIEKPFKVKKSLPPTHSGHAEMIEDEKSPAQQNTQILEEKEEHQMQFDNTTCNSSVIIPSMQKLMEGELPEIPQIFPTLRQTRSSFKMHFIAENEPRPSNTNRQMDRRSTSEYLSNATKQFMLSVKKEKKIKKRMKEKSLGQKPRQYSLRNH